jgi:hypothetical protein
MMGACNCDDRYWLKGSLPSPTEAAASTGKGQVMRYARSLLRVLWHSPETLYVETLNPKILDPRVNQTQL